MGAIVFDLDGTLVDSAPDLHAAANRMLAEAGAAPLDLPTLTRFIGNGVPKLVARIIAARDLDMADHAALTARFRAHYEADLATLTRPYPGVVAALDTLAAHGHVLGICTNKPEAPARRLLDLLGLGQRFAVIVGGDTLPVKKPDPAPLRHALAGLGPGAALYVGDSETDAETAQAAGLRFALFTEGYRKSPVAALPHDAAFADFAELPALAPRLMAAA